MANRLSRIVTRGGDAGQTSLGSGTRVDKNSPSIETLGAVDELNSCIGVVIAFSGSDAVRDTLTLVQHDLFDLGAQLSVPGTLLLSGAHLARIENSVEQMNRGLGPLKEFILPGGASASAFAHVARTVCRRAERCLVGLSQLDGQAEGLTQAVMPAGSFGLAYLNRLSDLLFIIARTENATAGLSDVLWERGKSANSSGGA